MKDLFKNLFKKNNSDKNGAGQYEQEKEIAQTGDSKQRLSLAKDSKTHKEILYYLAEKDPDPQIRKAVAENTSTPVHVTTLLAKDKDSDVRMALASRLVDLLPELTHEKHSQLYAYVVQALGTLALDEVLKIRRALSSTLKDHAHTPPKVAVQLARDVEREVSEPILRFCAALSDEDLLNIIRDHPAGWAVEAIAERPKVSEKVSKAVIQTENIPAGSKLLQNEGANITQTLLEHIIERAREFPEWHKPIAERKNLPPKAAQALAEFVDESVRRVLIERGDFDEQTSAELAAIVRRRADFQGEEKKSNEKPLDRVSRLASEGRLGDDVISDALGMRDEEFVIAALAFLLRVNTIDIDKIINMKAPKPIIAVCWKAGLSMRTALKMQQELVRIPSKDLIYPRGGTDYPMSEEDMTFQLEFLGLEAA